MPAIDPKDLSFEPLTVKNRESFEKLFGVRGACGNCWCMYYRLGKNDFNLGKKNNGNRNAMFKLIESGVHTGILAFYHNEAIAWCAVAPREDFIKLEKSRVHKRIDDKPVWSVPCFFIDKKYRGMGLTVHLLKGIINYAKEKGIGILEAYPAIPTQAKLPDSFLWVGLYKSFEKAGFKIVDHKSKNRPMVRYFVGRNDESGNR